MVNMKAGANQGERKRNQAGSEQSVSKAEKLSLKAEGGGLLALVNADGIALKVVAREKRLSEANAHVKSALVDPAALEHLAGSSASTRALLCRPGGDMVLSARSHEAANSGEVLLSEAQRLSLHVCEDEVYEWVPFTPPDADRQGLAWVSLEVQLLQPLADGLPPLEVDAQKLGQAVGKWLFDEVVSDNEIFIVSFASVQLVLRVVGLARHEPEEELGEETTAAAGVDSASAHCFRGVVGARTAVHVGVSTTFKSSVSQRKVSDGLLLNNAQPPPSRAPRNCVHVTTSDEEEFPVHRLLLKPCIALTKLVRDTTSTSPGATVGVDCATFDRVLLFLEACARGTPDAFSCDIQALEPLGQAAQALGCRPLREWCQRRLGDFQSRIRMHHWADIVKHNESGGCIVTMDGMVFDLEAWLPEHPGGSTIIPQQALNKDCTVFFELYHASRESFTYLREFYIGEIWKEERELVPLEAERASDDFMQQLRDYMQPHRFQPGVMAHKSF